jgi:hypothetical protein
MQTLRSAKVGTRLEFECENRQTTNESLLWNRQIGRESNADGIQMEESDLQSKKTEYKRLESLEPDLSGNAERDRQTEKERSLMKFCNTGRNANRAKDVIMAEICGI